MRIRRVLQVAAARGLSWPGWAPRSRLEVVSRGTSPGGLVRLEGAPPPRKPPGCQTLSTQSLTLSEMFHVEPADASGPQNSGFLAGTPLRRGKRPGQAETCRSVWY